MTTAFDKDAAIKTKDDLIVELHRSEADLKAENAHLKETIAGQARKLNELARKATQLEHVIKEIIGVLELFTKKK